MRINGSLRPEGLMLSDLIHRINVWGSRAQCQLSRPQCKLFTWILTQYRQVAFSAYFVFANETIQVCCCSLRSQQHPCGSAIEPTLKHNTNPKVDMHYSICNSRAKSHLSLVGVKGNFRNHGFRTVLFHTRYIYTAKLTMGCWSLQT